MAIYKLDWLERKVTKTGGEMIKASLTDENGSKNDGVAIFDKFPGYASLRPGMEVTGEITVTKKGIYTNKVLNAPKQGYTPPMVTKAAQVRQGDMIHEAQNRKNESISYFNSLNAAISLVTKMDVYKMDDVADTRKAITLWRDFFLEEWKKYEGGDVTDKHNAF